MLQLQRHIAQLAGLVHRGLGVAAAHHKTGDGLRRSVGNIAGLNKASIPQDRVAVRDGKYLVHFVGDEDEGLALLLQSPHNTEQMLDLRVVQRGGRLVQNKELRIGVKCLCDLQQLLFAGLQLVYQGVGVDIHAQVAHQLARLLQHGPLIQRAQLGQQFFAKKNVLVHLQIVKQVQLLVYKGDTCLFCPLDGNVMHLLSVKLDLALIPLMHTRQDVHQCGLTGAVLSQQRVYFPALHGKINVRKHFHTGE